MIERSMCQALWGDSEVSWEAQPALNTAGGILCLWREKIFKLEWIQEAQLVNIIRIYSLCDIQSKRVLWDSIK